MSKADTQEQPRPRARRYGTLALKAFASGGVGMIVTILCARVAGMTGFTVGLLLSAFVGPGLFTYVYRRSIHSASRAWTLGLIFGLGLTWLPLILFASRVVRGYGEPRAAVLLFGTIFLCAATTGSGRIVLQRRAQPRLQGSECLECGYSLIGNVSGRCPECGKKFKRSVLAFLKRKAREKSNARSDRRA